MGVGNGGARHGGRGPRRRCSHGHVRRVRVVTELLAEVARDSDPQLLASKRSADGVHNRIVAELDLPLGVICISSAACPTCESRGTDSTLTILIPLIGNNV